MDKYDKGETLGQGQFGRVIKATVKATGQVVAIKKVKLANKKEGIHMTALREIKILKELHSPHVIELVDVFISKGSNLALVFELMESDLEAVIKDTALVLSASDIKSYIHMALQGLAECHRHNVVHRDIKPNNLLIAKTGHLKLADFGLSKVCDSPEGCRTSQVFARWYRAPELLWGSTCYGSAVDIWAMGCVFAELILRKPWFVADSDIRQLQAIFTVLGTPTRAAWPGMDALPTFLEFSPCEGQPLHKIFPQVSEDARDLLAQMMQFDPARRITAEQALQHRYFKQAPAPTVPASLPRPKSRAEAPLELPPTRPADGGISQPPAKRVAVG